MSFWKKLEKPFFVSAPMADVTDVAFRALLAKYGAPDVFWTEFVSADGLYHTREIQKMRDEENPLMRDLAFNANEHPIVAQIFSSKPEMITYATKLVAELGFDGVDINMGCPDRAIERQGCGSAMIKTPEVARAIIRAAKHAANSFAETLNSTTVENKVKPMPVSVKTRIGYNKESLDEWLPVILEEAPAALTLHLRTRKEMSLVPANWELMKKAVEIRNRINPEVLLIGNGDVQDLEDGRKKVAESGCEGAMIGRGMFGNPWVFAELEKSDFKNSGKSDFPSPYEHSLEEKLAALIELARDFEKFVSHKNFAVLKKHIKAFVIGFPGAAELRAKLMEAESADELARIVHENPLY